MYSDIFTLSCCVTKIHKNVSSGQNFTYLTWYCDQGLNSWTQLGKKSFYVHEFGFRVRHASLRVGTLLSVVTKVSIKTHDEFRLFAWPGWKPTATHLVAEKPVIESKHQLQPGSADLHLFAGSWKLGGIAYVYIWLETPEGHPGQQAYTFVSYRRLSPQF